MRFFFSGLLWWLYPPPQKLESLYSDAASGWAGWALAHPKFGSSVNPITTRGADYASPPGFENLPSSLI